MTVVGNRLKHIRVKNRYSQTQIAAMCGVTQATIGRYETSVVEPPIEKLLWYAEKFEVSLDYIFGRTDDSKGNLYAKGQANDSLEADADKFIEMFFEPGTAANTKLKEMLVKLLEEHK